MTYQLNLLCGCTIDYERGRMLDARGVTFCPLHAAAPLMLEACKMAELLFVSIFDVYDVNTKNTVRKLRTAIAAAEPEEHNG